MLSPTALFLAVLPKRRRSVSGASSSDGRSTGDSSIIAAAASREGSPASRGDDCVVRPAMAADDYVWEFPMQRRTNWGAVAILLFYIGASVAYFQFRCATVRDLGPYAG
jgi:hypothetical protein